MCYKHRVLTLYEYWWVILADRIWDDFLYFSDFVPSTSSLKHQRLGSCSEYRLLRLRHYSVFSHAGSASMLELRQSRVFLLLLNGKVRVDPFLTCFCASFFPFCPLSWPPLFLPFSRHIFALFSPSKSALFCRAKCTAQSLERGRSGMDLSTKFGKEIPFPKSA